MTVTPTPLEVAVDALPPGVPQRRLLTWLLLVAVGMTAMFQGIQQILIPAQIEAIDPANKIANLALVTAVSSLTSIIGLIAGGAVSDRTHGRWGRRTPSLVLGGAVSAALIVAMGFADGLAPLLGLYAAVWFFANYYQGAITAVLPERVPVKNRGVGSAVMALGMPIGVIVGVNFAAQFDRPVAYAGLAGLIVIVTAGFILFARERPALPRAAAKKQSALAAALGFFASFRTMDFTLAFVGRFVMFLSVFSVVGFTYYILQDHIGVAALPGGNVQVAVSILLSIQMVGCVISAAVSGWMVDRWKRPKLFVTISSIGMAVTLLIPMIWPTWPALLVWQASIGLFFGAYLAIDLALMSLVLPDRESEGRDMAILAVATGAPQILSPLVAAGLIAWLGYSSLFLFAAILALIGGIVVFFIKSVR